MKVLSLFSGVGGFDLGLEAAGMQTIYQCEWDKHATNILNRHWSHVPKWGDISTLTAQEILRHGQQPDVVAWGSPCQDLSVAGKRAGLSGERSGLFHEGIRLIKELRKETNNEYPRISIWENVAGAMSSNRGADFGEVLNEMAEAGAMVIEWAILDAQHFGVPQRRRRVFVIAIFDPAIAGRCPDPLLPVGESLRGDSAKGRKKRQATSRTVGTSLANGNEVANTISASLYHKSTVVNQDVNNNHLVVGSLAARDYKGVGSQYVNEGKVIVEPMLFENSYRDGPRIAKDDVTQTLSAKMGTGGGNTPMVAIGIQGTVIGRQDHNGPGGKGHTEEGDPMFTLTSTDVHAVAFDTQFGSNANVFEDVSPTLKASQQSPSVAFEEPLQYDGYNQRIYNDGISTTIRIGRDSSDFIVPKPTVEMAVRRLTPVECERLMGWPDNWTDGQSDTHRYKQCGNGVASPVAKWIAQHLLNI